MQEEIALWILPRPLTLKISSKRAKRDREHVISGRNFSSKVGLPLVIGWGGGVERLKDLGGGENEGFARSICPLEGKREDYGGMEEGRGSEKRG